MSYNNNNTTETDVWANQQRVKLIRFSKVRQDRNNEPARGVLIENEAGETRWVSESSHNKIFRESAWGSWIWYYGSGHRPSLGLLPISSLTPSSQEYLTQQNADYYAKLAEQNKRDIEPHRVPANLAEPQPEPMDDDEALITLISSTLSQFVMLMKDFNPGLSEESIIKLAISGYIQYTKQKQNIPY